MKLLPSGAASVRVGDRVRNRGEQWVVDAIEPFDDCLVITLNGADPANHHVVRRLVSPADRLHPIVAPRRLRLVGRARWRRDCRTLLASQGPPSLLRTAITARMQLLPHQLEPALAMVRGMGSRVLIADAVGLGKTVQAGLIVAELRARHAGARTLVLVPAGVRDQWVHELAGRFDLMPMLFDAAAIRARQRLLPIGVNPWSTESLVVTSTDYVKRPEIRRALLDVPWDTVVVDEAHGCVAPSDRHEAVAALCRMAPHVVLLTATPHNGDDAAFESLCGIGERDDALLVFRRTRLDAGLPDDRRVHPLVVTPTDAERRLRHTLQAFAAAVEHDNAGRDERVALVVGMLRKRALSSASSLERSVLKRLAVIRPTPSHALAQLALPFDPDGELDAADAVPDWRVPVLHDPDAERAWLLRLADEARTAAGAESKLGALARLLRRIHEPVVVFTEYRDTLQHLRQCVAPHAELLHGGMTREERRRALLRFARTGLLLATDAAGEGLNLHDRSRIVINLELPWNPMRLEQRIGRVDRIGQSRRVHAFHLIAAESDEMTMRTRLLARIAAADAAIGAADPLRRTRAARISSEPNPTLRLIDDARAEAARLATARRIGAMAPGSAPLLAREHAAPVSLIMERAPVMMKARGAVRVHVRGRRLALIATSAQTWNGDRVALTIIGALWPADAELTLDALDAVADAAVSMSPASSPTATLDTHHAFWTCRLQRLAAMADDLDTRPRTSQPGLFDRRDAHAVALSERRARQMRADLLTRIEAASRWRVLITTPPLVVLVLNR